jgi:hypothetical protein
MTLPKLRDGQFYVSTDKTTGGRSLYKESPFEELFNSPQNVATLSGVP